MSEESAAGARVTATPAGVALAPLDAIADGAALNFVLQLRAGRFHGFVVRRGDSVFGYVDRCPHAGLPLAQVPRPSTLQFARCSVRSSGMLIETRQKANAS